MHAYGFKILESVCHFMDELIRDYGHLLFMGFAHVALAVIVWILCGELRRKNAPPSPHTSIIVIHQPPPPPPPLPLERECDFPSDDDEDSFAA